MPSNFYSAKAAAVEAGVPTGLSATRKHKPTSATSRGSYQPPA